ncbi:hypothetical protein IFU02_019995 [Pantoea agglomerans]|uniref:hypothetical protein n=1 Tax=Enterobacter agglomerans TaxID=549 RepID=UPI00177F6B18|nr:hypothetical protein [Pantoea agglomerans]WVL84726.1 hypothetical protein IFU02_019995 [Pantoea agglomerans]
MSLLLAHALTRTMQIELEQERAKFRIKAETAIIELIASLKMSEEDFLASVYRVTGKSVFNLIAGEDDFDRVVELLRDSPEDTVKALLVINEGDAGFLRAALYRKPTKKGLPPGRIIHADENNPPRHP